VVCLAQYPDQIPDEPRRMRSGKGRTSIVGCDVRDTAPPTELSPAATPVRAERRVAVGAALGILTGAVALGVAHLVAGLLDVASSPILAVGGAVVDVTPEWLKSFAIRTFGTADKQVLLGGIGVVLALAAVLLGIASVRRPIFAIVGLLGFALVGALAAVTRPANGPMAAVPSLAGGMAGIGAYVLLRRTAGLPPVRGPEVREGKVAEPWHAPRGYDRRRFLGTAVAAAGLALAADRVGEWFVRRADASDSRAAVGVPDAVDPAEPVPDGADLGVAGLDSFITPNDRFYRVDTALFVPSVSAEGWTLEVHGMVEEPLSLTYEQLVARPLIERDITLACVSNEVGGRYVGNARWVGVPLADLLSEARLLPGADQLVSRSADGWTAGTPTSVVTDGRDAMLAVAMNGEPLPLEHGFPVRMIVPGLYGYVSATKWLVELELTTFDAFDPYWVERGWAERAPIKTQSRIDTPSQADHLLPGEVAIAGVAWAQHRGIEKVEVRIDDGRWLAAELGTADTEDTWRQWVLRWRAVPGSHMLTVRAIDGTGALQTEEVAPPFPDGATGYHTIEVDVA
jgi:DMSO/TMAO reductase YedYZ molybdopterin-dependent catalytic subunit